MKVIDLLNKIANGEEVSKYIKYEDNIYEFDTMMGDYYSYKIKKWFSDKYCDGRSLRGCLNEEVEILEEEPYVEICGRWFTKSEYDEFVKDEKEKKIPEKLRISSHIGGTFESEQEYRNKRDDEITEKINSIIDCLKSKGE